MAISTTGTRFATGDIKGNVRLWMLKPCERRGPRSLQGVIYGMQFQPDGHTILSVDAAELRIWRAGSAATAQSP